MKNSPSLAVSLAVSLHFGKTPSSLPAGAGDFSADVKQFIASQAFITNQTPGSKTTWKLITGGDKLGGIEPLEGFKTAHTQRKISALISDHLDRHYMLKPTFNVTVLFEMRTRSQWTHRLLRLTIPESSGSHGLPVVSNVWRNLLQEKASDAVRCFSLHDPEWLTVAELLEPAPLMSRWLGYHDPSIRALSELPSVCSLAGCSPLTR